MTGLARYSRQVALREVGVHGQEVLRDSSALVIGLGGLGCPAAQALAGAGIGTLAIADRDRVELSNLHRQPLYAMADVGRPKTLAARERLAAINPEVVLTAHEGRLEADKLDAMVAAADVVLDCTDNFPTRFAINAACVRARVPLVSGAVIRFEGQLAVFDLRRTDSPCYACVFPDQGETAERCEEAGILGPAAGVVGNLQALAALKLLLGRGSDAGRLQLWNAMDLQWRGVVLKRDPACPVCSKVHP